MAGPIPFRFLANSFTMSWLDWLVLLKASLVVDFTSSSLFVETSLANEGLNVPCFLRVKD